MIPVLVGHHAAGSPEWLADRQYRLGGSEIAAVMGLSPWASYFTLYATKKGVLPPQEDTPELEWGRRHEHTIWERVCEEHDPHGWGEYGPGLYAHPERPWQVGSPDGILMWGPEHDEPVVVEIKTAQRGEKWGSVESGEFPVYYRTQLLWTMDVMGASVGILAVLIGLSDFRMYYLSAEDEGVAEEVALMLEYGEEFVAALQSDEWPRPDDGSSATYEAVRIMHPEIDEGLTVELPSDLADSLILSKAALTVAERDYARARALVAHEMGTAQHAWSAGVHIAARYAKTTKDGSPGVPYVEADRRQTNLRHKSIIEAMEEQ